MVVATFDAPQSMLDLRDRVLQACLKDAGGHETHTGFICCSHKPTFLTFCKEIRQREFAVLWRACVETAWEVVETDPLPLHALEDPSFPPAFIKLLKEQVVPRMFKHAVEPVVVHGSLLPNGSFRKLWIPYFGALIIRILLFGVLY